MDELTQVMSRHKAALTRAENTGDPTRIIAACDAAFADFEQVGWPDCWSRWQRAKDDAMLIRARARTPQW